MLKVTALATICFALLFFPYVCAVVNVQSAENARFPQLINDYRAQQGLFPLTSNTLLNKAAQEHANDQIRKAYFNHKGSFLLLFFSFF